jgi:hypothetical protein
MRITLVDENLLGRVARRRSAAAHEGDRHLPSVLIGSRNEFKIGFLYAQKDSSWLIESFSQFRLAVKRINDQPPPSASFPELTFVAYDSGPNLPIGPDSEIQVSNVACTRRGRSTDIFDRGGASDRR